ncbi:BTB/POZ domain-containing protein [Acanthamoeba polyphaga moumouvirus]|uniref:BTB/POZ domain-containing protein n=1 Tax=Acanthamoeba polyphaga moumouvirus TaxID=1269028 RepID=L7RCN1_9VIRU|nr:BTB/POZ domain-containing protein [Acanthamoeba polyphaga moumouvirus]AGC02369.1 BTB/POZ domain-containing protein [Acanthamoeba polyphaga moumouvirus]AQN68724.1 BTB/POZ domain protein [Saudi moumouvirus]
MDPLPLSTLFNSDIFCDLTIDLVDNNSMTTLNVHKSILYLGCPYFRSMFNGFSEANSSKITINVPNVEVMCDIIQSFYEITIKDNNHWKYQLNMFRCKDFLNMKTTFPKEINIPENEFEELIEFVTGMGFNKDTTKLIIQNIPKTYDFSKLLTLSKKLNCDHDEYARLIARHIPKLYDFNELSKDLIKDIWKIVDTYYILLISYKNINIIDSEGQIYRTINSCSVENICYLENSHWIAYNDYGCIYVYDIELDKYILKKKYDIYRSEINKIVNYYDYLITCEKINKKNNTYMIKLYNIYDNSSKNIFELEDKNVFIIDMGVVKDELIVTTFTHEHEAIIYVLNLKTNKLVQKWHWNDIYINPETNIIYNDSYIALYFNPYYCYYNELFLLKHKTGKKNKKTSMSESEIIGICWGNNNDLISCYKDGTINFYNPKKDESVKTINIKKTIYKMIKFSEDCILIKHENQLILININDGKELKSINIDSNIEPLMKISSGFDKLSNLLPKIKD